MNTPKPLGLQLCPLSDYLAAGLATRLELVPWFELDDAARSAFLANRASECRLVLTGGHIGCPSELMQALPALELIAINGVGFDKVDLALAAARGVAVSNTPDVLTDDVADLAVGLIIAQMRGIAAGDAFVRAGRWTAGELPLGRKVSGKRFGIVGLGRIGSAIAARLAPFGPVAYTSRSAKNCPYTHMADLAELAHWADCLIVACPANAATANLIDARILGEIGPRGLLVNIARGSIVDEPALVEALASGALGFAALDVFAHEPQVPLALREAANTVLTPHVGSATGETRIAMADLVLANVDAFLGGAPLPTPVS